MTEPFLELIDSFPRQTVIVVGDAMLDHYVMGDVNRTSAEAPVPIHHAYGEEWIAGGAANVARNLSAQGARVIFLSVCGEDDSGGKLAEELENDKGIVVHLILDRERPTTVKTRYVCQGQQMLRVDWERTDSLSEEVLGILKNHIEHYIQECNGIIISDYGKGVVSEELCQFVVEKASASGVEIMVDPKGRDYQKYRGVTCITPNKKEAEDATGIKINNDESSDAAAAKLQEIIDGKAICITLSAGGVVIYPKGEPSVRVSASAREVFDVTGAGDTFLSTLALARFAGARFGRAIELGNIAAGIAVSRSGVAVISTDDLKAAISGEGTTKKWVTLPQLLERRKSFRRAGRKVVFTNGCFDLLSAMHIRLLERARAMGDVLIVALNSDPSVRLLKGEGRPLLPLSERIELLSSLQFVDYVAVFDKETPEDLLELLEPDVLVKGDTGEKVVGSEIVKKYGGEVKVLDLKFTVETKT